ncbi:MAG: haloacid dehalogenase [Armatimonadetes bacterium]|nr:haloacid dehalogenase [Armatimonadota bacterium]
MSIPLVDPEARQILDAMHKRRESALAICRQIIQLCSKSIRHVHRKQFAEAEVLLEEAKQRSRALRAELTPSPAILYAGYLQDAEKELVEAAAVFAITQSKPVPSLAELGVDVVSYLNGLGEAASECRRYALDELRHSRGEEAERILIWMESVYDELITYDYPDSLSGGLRRTCDALRAVVERTRSDYTLTLSQKELLAELKKYNSSR